MDKNSRSTTIALTLLLGIFLQVLFVAADSIDSPGKAAERFAVAYLNLDADEVSSNLCTDMLQNEEDIVGDYLYRAEMEAKERGFKRAFMKSKLYQVETRTISRTGDKAIVRVTGKARVNICPFFSWISQIFHIGNTYHVDEILTLVKEGNRWKVCGDFFALPQSMNRI